MQGASYITSSQELEMIQRDKHACITVPTKTEMICLIEPWSKACHLNCHLESTARSKDTPF
eukprot:c34103_g1_i1 orf=175-357(+)